MATCMAVAWQRHGSGMVLLMRRCWGSKPPHRTPIWDPAVPALHVLYLVVPCRVLATNGHLAPQVVEVLAACKYSAQEPQQQQPAQ